MNTVSPDNFNETMQGYFDYSIDFAMDRAEFTEEQIRLLRHGLSWAKDEMTMQDAREYKSKR
jgi:hypothetical protein